jgi:hypothetical protein
MEEMQMLGKSKKILGVFLVIGALAFSGCAHKKMSTDVSQLQSQLREKEKAMDKLESSNRDKDLLIANYQREIQQKSKALSETEMQHKQAMEASKSAAAFEGAELLPPKASPGECYARVFVPPTYRTTTEEVLKRGPSERVEIVPAKYEWVEEKILVREASERLEVIPAQYDWVEEKTLAKQASTRMEEIPAKYDWVEEKVLVKPAHTIWKKGRGPIERIDNATGEIMCLVEVPATYRTVKKKVMSNPPGTLEVAVPAEYQTLKKKVMVKPATTRKIEIPAEYKTVKVRKLVSPPQERRITIPAEYQTVSKTEQATDGRMEWRRILCETNVTPQIVSSIQTALLKAGHNPGPVDGILGPQTHGAIAAYQKEKGLVTGGLTYRTMESLGIKAGQ